MHLDYDTDDGAGWRARLGLIVLQGDETLESEFRRFLDVDGVALYVTRVPSGLEVNNESLAAMADHIPAAARLLPPATELDVVGYACTSGATVIGTDEVARLIRGARPTHDAGSFANAAITDPLTAVVAACRTLGAARIGFVTPYVADVSYSMRTVLEGQGLEIAGFGSFEQGEERIVARIAPASIHAAILQVGRAAPCDAVFVSCTNARTLDILDAAESDLGLPVVSSNQALAWHMLRSAGIDDPRPDLGRLFRA